MEGGRHNRTAQKITLIAVGAATLIILVSAIVLGTFMHGRLSQKEVIIGEAKVVAQVADDIDERKRGLSGTKELKPDTGMLFIFDQVERQGIWMKDMNYSLDILWLDEDMRVVYIKQKVSPSTYPETFAAETPSKYVLELPSGFVGKHNIKEGTIAAFSR